MTRRIQSTDLKTKTKKVLDLASKGEDDLILYVHDQPKAVMISYDKWIAENAPKRNSKKGKKEKTLWDRVKDKVISDPTITDSAAYFRKRRDEEIPN